jgi:hypothetical protein
MGDMIKEHFLGVVFWDLERRIDAHWGFLEFLWYLIEIYYY